MINKMQKNRIHIEKLRIRLPSGMAPDARSIGTNIGRELMHRVAALGAGRAGAKRIDDLSIAPIRSANAASIPDQVAGKVVDEIGKRLDERGKR